MRKVFHTLQNNVSKGAFAFWMRRWGAKTWSMWYLLDNMHSRIERRPDTLESILFDAAAQMLWGPALVGFIVSEVSKDGLETKRDGDSENPMKQNLYQLGHRCKCAIDWPLISGKFRPCWSCCYVTDLQSKVVLRDGLTPTEFRFLMFVITAVLTKEVSPGLPERSTRQRHWLPKENSYGLRWKYSYHLMLIVDSEN